MTPEQALAHPNWKMGQRITIDSATLMNKGFEVIEAHWLFGMDLEKIHVVIHPQSTIHSMVEFVDGSILAQLGPTDMRMPIQYALTYPERVASNGCALDWSALRKLDFEEVPADKFPCLALAKHALREGGPSALRPERRGRDCRRGLLGRPPVVSQASPRLSSRFSNACQRSPLRSIEDVLAADAEARRLAREASTRRALSA